MSVAGEAVDHEPVRLGAYSTLYDGAVKLPGYGSPPDRCRGRQPVGFCEHGHVLLGQSSCGTRRCPDHWRDWIEGGVANMVARLVAFQVARDARMVAGVASPPQDRQYSREAVWRTRTEANSVLEDAGIHGGAVVTHAYRTNDRGDMLYETAKQNGDVEDGTGRWAFLRDVADDWPEMGEYIEAAPHYHVLGPAGDVDPSGIPDDWVVKRFRDLPEINHLRDSEAYEEYVAPAYYLLTHAAVQEDRQSTTYFGAIHPSNFDPSEELTAAEWERIQIEAEAALEPDEASAGAEECPRDGCEAVVKDLRYLDDFLDDDDCVESLLAQRGGRKRWLRLRGTRLWVDGMTDRPPPAVMRSEEKLLNWLEVQGETGVQEPRQSQLPAA